MKGHLLMSQKERRRQLILEGVKENRLTLKMAALQLGISYRQCRRAYQRYLKEGEQGLLHKSRGNLSNRRKSLVFKEEVLNYYQENLSGFGPTFATEKLIAAGYTLDHDTLRRWLCQAGLWQVHRQRAVYRSQRERRQRFGELIQMDGSHHHWFGSEKSCLINMVDDATGRTLARLYPEETTEGVMRTLWDWIALYGIPQALYVDRKTVYVTSREPTLEEELAGEEPLTAFGKACQKLGIVLIKAWSPQAKGRVERNHAVYQDRLVKEFKLQRINTLSEANTLLGMGFCHELNQRFACLPMSEDDAHRPLTPDVILADIFCMEITRVVRNDWTFRHDNHCYQIYKTSQASVRPKARITVRTRLDRTQTVFYQGHCLSYGILEQRPKAVPRPAKLVYRSPLNHPLKQASFKRMQAKKLSALVAGQGV